MNNDLNENSQEQLSTEQPNNISDNGNKKKNPGIIIMLLITIIYIIGAVLLFIKTISSSDMLAGLAAVAIVIYAPIGLAILWGVYGLWLFLYKRFSAKKLAGIKSVVIVVLILGAFIVIKNYGPALFFSTKSVIEENKTSQKGTISSIERETVCIKENNNYVTYVVADNKYAFTSNSLLVRKNALNKKLKYYKSGEKDDYDYYKKYDNSLIDEYLTSDEWVNRFDKDFLNIINNTTLYQEYSFTDSKTVRKFFIISTNEYFGFHTQAEGFKDLFSGGMPEDWSYYYTEDNVYDDNGNLVDYWIVRIDDDNNAVHKCNSEGCWPLNYNDNLEYYFRPAFTIPNSTKIVKNSDSNYNCKWLIGINN